MFGQLVCGYFVDLSQKANKHKLILIRGANMYFHRLCLAIVALITLFGCSEGSHLLVGTPRNHISPEQVVIYSQAPPVYEVVAIVAAKGKNAVTMQNKQNYAIKELKAQAASVGANGILLERIDEVPVSTAGTYVQTSKTTGMFVGSSGTEVIIRAKAIFNVV